jgi:hypothetical protein
MRVVTFFQNHRESTLSANVIIPLTYADAASRPPRRPSLINQVPSPVCRLGTRIGTGCRRGRGREPRRDARLSCRQCSFCDAGAMWLLPIGLALISLSRLRVPPCSLSRETSPRPHRRGFSIAQITLVIRESPARGRTSPWRPHDADSR